MQPEPFVGIDFGTSKCAVAWYNSRTGQAEILRNEAGEEKTPSVVYIGDDGVVVGKLAEERIEDPHDRPRIVVAVKREIAKKQLWLIGNRQWTAIEIAAEIIRKLIHDAETYHFNNKVERAVITCPAIFNEREREAIRQAGMCAGLREVELVEEPVAAATAYAHEGYNVGNYVLVYDLGGGTFDLAFLACRDDGTFYVAEEPVGERVGGEDFDRLLYDECDKIVRGKFREPIEPDRYDLDLLRRLRQYKENLSFHENPRPISWVWSRKGRLLQFKFSRKEFEQLITPYVDKTMELTARLHEKARQITHGSHSLVLVGGSSRIPLIRRVITEEMSIEPFQWQKQDVAVALGAAYFAQEIWGEGATFRRQKESKPAIYVISEPTSSIANTQSASGVTERIGSPGERILLLNIAKTLLLKLRTLLEKQLSYTRSETGGGNGPSRPWVKHTLFQGSAQLGSLRVAVLGTEGSGKTVLTCVLAKRFNVPGPDGMFLEPLDAKTLKFVEQVWATLQCGEWPPSTPPGEAFCLRWGLFVQNRRICEIGVLDISGQDLRKIVAHGEELCSTTHCGSLPKLVAHCKSADAVVLVVNLGDFIEVSFERRIDNEATIKAVLDYLFTRERRICLVFTQCDRFGGYASEREGWENLIKELMPNVYGAYVWPRRVKVFIVAAVGECKMIFDANGTSRLAPKPGFTSYGLELVWDWLVRNAVAYARKQKIQLFAEAILGGVMYLVKIGSVVVNRGAFAGGILGMLIPFGLFGLEGWYLALACSFWGTLLGGLLYPIILYARKQRFLR
ncbi:MAG: hypothetical protein KatS3mg110_4438 [Pirellulaceae bacterium]|nr:MAG: hypothetical protein KatS3mg110_4438 [Pirellulaceae bacterium]